MKPNPKDIAEKLAAVPDVVPGEPGYDPLQDVPLSEAEQDILLGNSRTSRWRASQAGTFPKVVEISEGRTGRLASMLRRWKEEITRKAFPDNAKEADDVAA